MSDLDILDEEYNRPSVLVDDTKLSAEYVPKNLLFRSEQLKNLARHFKGLFTNRGLNRGIIITGPIGTGKTSVTKKFGMWAQSRAQEQEINLRYVHINCRRNQTPYMLLLAVARELNSHIPSRGYSANELMEILVEILESQEIKLLLVLDEIDYFTEDDLTDLLYILSRATDEQTDVKHLISLILVARKYNFVNHLDESTKSSLTTAHMELEPYTKDQLYKILEDRITDSFQEGAVTEESIDLAAEIAANRGDARQALELIWMAGKSADSQTSKYVYPDHVREAKSNVDPSLLRHTISDLSFHRHLLLLGISRYLQRSKAAYVSTGEAKEAYQIVCEEYQEEPRKHTQVWEYLKDFQKQGILTSEISGKGHRGTTQLLSLQDATASELEKAVLKRIEKKG